MWQAWRAWTVPLKAALYLKRDRGQVCVLPGYVFLFINIIIIRNDVRNTVCAHLA